MSATTPHQATPAHPRTGAPPAQRTPLKDGDEPTLGALVHDLTEQIPALIRSELRLAQAEVTEKGKSLGLGIGMFSASGLLAWFALAAAITAGTLGLAEAMPGWAAALVMTGILLLAAGLFAVIGRGKVSAATPPVPERAITGLKEDLETVKEIRP